VNAPTRTRSDSPVQNSLRHGAHSFRAMIVKRSLNWPRGAMVTGLDVYRTGRPGG
jgi:hypothetical protein